MADEFIGGWLIDEEDFPALEALPFEDDSILLMRGYYEEIRFDPRKVLKVEHQGNVGACQGHSLSSVREFTYMLETDNRDIQLSRAMGYYETQRIDGISGDRGSTISGGIALLRRIGLCIEELWKYTGRYNPKRPANWSAIVDNAEKYKILRDPPRLRSYDAVRTFVGSGQGGIHIGIGWGRGMDVPVLESWSSGGGGHSVGLYCLSERVDSKGRPYVWMKNSWGANWANKGWSEWSPTAIERMFGHQHTVMIGVTPDQTYSPRKFSLDDWKKALAL